MKKSSIIVVVIWAYIVGISLFQGFTLPTSNLAQNFPIPWPILVLMPLVIVFGSYFNRDIVGAFSIGKRIDQWFGQDTYRSFMKSLRLELLFSSMSFGIGVIGVVRTLVLNGTSGPLSISMFFISAGFAFLVAHLIAKRRKIYELRAYAEPAKSYSPTSKANFWNEAKKRRNQCFYSFLGWLIAGPILVTIYSYLFSGISKQIPPIAALLTWGSVIFWVQFRFRQLRCFRCGEQAFSSPIFFMKDAKCRNCGVTQKDN
jgi:hypothetical protein